MNNQLLESLIYNQLYAATNYELLETIAPNQEIKDRLHNFAADCKNNANFLDQLYQFENTASFYALVQKPQFHGNFFDSLSWVLQYVETSYRVFFMCTSNADYTANQRHLCAYITGIMNNHSIGISQILLTK